MELDLNKYLKLMVDRDGSDLYLLANAPPAAKFHGQLKSLDNIRLTREQLERLALRLMDEDQRRQFEKSPELNQALFIPQIGRFRVNIFKQRNAFALVLRNVKMDIPNLDVLGLPEILKSVVMEKNGLVLFVGSTGSGKSTSLAALLDYRNTHASGHIITIEDPIEYLHPHKKSLISQREVGVDTNSYEEALKNTLRQAPDVILIGEIRSRETMEHALAFAETGHLCLSTLHATTASQALDRIINFFPEDRRDQLLLDLSLNLKAFVAQRLLPTVDGKRVAAIEILLGSERVKDVVRKGETHLVKEIMEKSTDIGMQTFDQHLLNLFQSGQIALKTALNFADSANNLRIKIELSDKPVYQKPVKKEPSPAAKIDIDFSAIKLDLPEK